MNRNRPSVNQAAGLLILIGFISACLIISVSAKDVQSGSIVGRWNYTDCNIKNTSVRGYITFKADGTFYIHIKARDDCPVKDVIKGVYLYKIDGEKITTNYTGGHGMAGYYHISGNTLFLSEIPYSDGMEHWKYKLERRK